MTDAATDRVRVLWLIKGLGPGGAERLLVNQAVVRDRERFVYEATYLVPTKDHLTGELEALGVPTTTLDAPREWDPRWMLALRRRLRDRPVDVIHGHSPYVASATRLLIRTLPRAVRPAHVYTEHNRWPRHRPSTRMANRLTFGLDDAQFAVSSDVRATMPSRRQARVTVLTHGVDVVGGRALRAEREAMRVELGLEPDDIVIGIVANLRREKGYDTLLDAAAKVAAAVADPGWTGPRVRFVSVGQGPLAREIRERHAALGLDASFALLGYRTDARRVMTAFDIFTLASRHEGLPVALMDALVLGLPVVATDVGGIPEAVTPDVEGVLVPADDPDALAAAYLALAGDDARRARYGAAAAVRGDEFDIARATAVLEQRYLDVAARSRS